MNGAELDAAIEQANRIFSRQYRPGDGPHRNAEQPTSESQETGWPSKSYIAELSFRQPHAKLFPFIGRKVRTPTGSGTLIQVFEERVTVLLDADRDKCVTFTPGEIEPVNWHL